MAFDVEVGVNGLGNSQQETFMPVVCCAYCGEKAHIAFTAMEYPNVPGEVYVCNDRPTNVNGIWPHDLTAFAVYICPSCGKATAEWNQS